MGAQPTIHLSKGHPTTNIVCKQTALLFKHSIEALLPISAIPGKIPRAPEQDISEYKVGRSASHKKLVLIKCGSKNKSLSVAELKPISNSIVPIVSRHQFFLCTNYAFVLIIS
jgi:hypothetical protein